jgi:hypothetical protein
MPGFSVNYGRRRSYATSSNLQAELLVLSMVFEALTGGLKGELNHYGRLVHPTCNEEYKSLNFRLDSIPNIPDS